MCRGARARTGDLAVPNGALYQTELHPVISMFLCVSERGLEPPRHLMTKALKAFASTIPPLRQIFQKREWPSFAYHSATPTYNIHFRQRTCILYQNYKNYVVFVDFKNSTKIGWGLIGLLLYSG